MLHIRKSLEYWLCIIGGYTFGDQFFAVQILLWTLEGLENTIHF